MQRNCEAALARLFEVHPGNSLGRGHEYPCVNAQLDGPPGPFLGLVPYLDTLQARLVAVDHSGPLDDQPLAPGTLDPHSPLQTLLVQLEEAGCILLVARLLVEVAKQACALEDKNGGRELR